MKITFPYMGTPLVYKKLVEMLGHEPITPNKPTQRIIEQGVKNSPEFACFPMKVIMGSYIDALERGAEVILSSGGNGPCRAGFYGQMHEKILNSLGYNPKFIILDSIHRDFKGFIKNFKMITQNVSLCQLYSIFKFLHKMSSDLDQLEMQLQTKRAYEINRVECNKVWEKIQSIFDKTYIKKDLIKAKEKCQILIDDINIRKIPENEKIRIGIVGEIYAVMESSINMKMEELLGSFGCEVRRAHYLSHWIEDNVVPKIFSKSKDGEICKKGQKYIEVAIGGHAQQTIGHIVDYKEQGFDGIVHLMPFACLPELVSQSIIPKMSNEIGIPVLTIALDEQMGVANNTTRIEAFIDIIRNSKEKKYRAS
ncbi:hypothetical protein IZY60_02695 [Lutibacter sp. B2]|nr:hypothetical protein [Lutibacter sp. B2]